ncbi:hypothetical protein [Streptomyces sp. NPDC051636]|uniref:hypothetical protein n=1 Tax=Streptomyces sp. NPDC051636 TaxID=3365663 RepID=UPI00378EB2F2
MLRKEYAGYFHSDLIFNGRTEALHAWRVTTGCRDVAQVTSRKLGGEVRGSKDLPEGRWEVLTKSPAVEILVREVTGDGIAFTLPGETAIGEFFFRSEMWNPEDIAKVSADGDLRYRPCQLKLEPVEFKTRTGLTILYVLPSIQLTASGV